MKSHASATDGDIDLRLRLESLSALFSKLTHALGPCIAGPDTAKQVIHRISEVSTEDRKALILTYWGDKHLHRVEPVLTQIALLENILSQQEEIWDSPV